MKLKLTFFIFILLNSFFPGNLTAEETGTSVSNLDFFSVSPFPDAPWVTPIEDVVLLSSKNCTGTGDKSEGSLTCRQTYSNGDSLLLTTEYETLGNDLKAETLISFRDASGDEKESKTIRHKTRYAYLEEEKVKEAEFFDIVKRPSGGKATREIFLYEYHLESRQIKTASWALYQGIGVSSSETLTYHAFLLYDPDGNPLKGSADKYRDGIKIKSTNLDSAVWNQWGERVFKPLRGG